MHDHRALRRATDPSALAAWWLGLAVGVAAVVGVALDACGATAQGRVSAPANQVPVSAPANQVPGGVLSWGDGAGPRRVEITERDLLWAARMLLGSQQGGAVAGGNVATDARLWAAAQRHALQCDRDLRAGRPCRWRRFSDSFRAYSTAIAPQWSARGWCAPGGLHAGTSMCSPARLRRRAWVVSRTWRDIAACCRDLRGYLRAWARGGRANPVPGACHTDQAGGLVDGVVVGSNAYRCDRESCRWPAGYVRLTSAP